MSELPDFTTAPAWMDALGGVVAQRQVMDYRGPLGDFSAGAPWTPLDTADGWGKRIDRDALAKVTQSVLDCWFSGDSGVHGEIADAVIAALPELMGGGALTAVDDAMVERAARAVYGAAFADATGWDMANQSMRDTCRTLSNAALNAALGVES